MSKEDKNKLQWVNYTTKVKEIYETKYHLAYKFIKENFPDYQVGLGLCGTDAGLHYSYDFSVRLNKQDLEKIVESISNNFGIYPENYSSQKINERRDKIKNLLKESFGKSAKGTRVEKVVILDVDNMYAESENSQLAGITLGPSFMFNEFAIGNFLSQDGYALEIINKRKLRGKAEKYSRLYEEAFGEKPIINFVNLEKPKYDD